MIPYQITVPTDKAEYNQKMKLLAMGSGVWYTITESNDGTLYQLEFDIQSEADLFKETVGKALPELN